jgi:hypothetical protein
MSAAQSPEIDFVSPEQLVAHPDLADFPGLSDDQLAALTISVKERGIQAPLVVDDEHQVFDGRARLAIALALNLPSVPVIYRPEKDVLAFAIESAVNRRQLTRPAIAFLLFEQHPELAASRGAKAGRPKKSAQFAPISEKAGRPKKSAQFAPISEKAGRPKKSAQFAPISEPESFTSLSLLYRVERKDFTRLLAMKMSMLDEEWAALRHAVLYEEKSIATQYAGWSGARGHLVGGVGSVKIFGVTANGQLDLNLGLFPRTVASLRTCWSGWEKNALLHTPMIEQWEKVLEDLPDDLAKVTLAVLQKKRRAS